MKQSPLLRLARLTLAVAATTLSTSNLPLLAQEDCALQPLRFLCDGCVVQRRMTVRRDAGCVERNQTETVILGVQLTVRPRNGSFGRSSAALQAYVPRKGYVGADYYEFVLTHEIAGKPAKTTIKNFITVQ
ncbi:MAG: hypothetical protein ABWZ80_07255 [Beijerinckiaceae bacterium]